MLEVHIDPIFPEIFGDIIDAVPVVVGGVVDQHIERPRLRAQFADATLHCGDVGQVNAFEARTGRCGQCARFLLANVEECHLAALLGEGLHDFGADPGTAARDQHPLAAQAW